jgi:hypothetical protein
MNTRAVQLKVLKYGSKNKQTIDTIICPINYSVNKILKLCTNGKNSNAGRYIEMRSVYVDWL